MENSDCLSRVLFRLAGRDWSWQQALACAEHSGLLESCLARFRRSQAAVAEAMTRGDCLPDNAFQDAITEWRYAFNLISAQETENWLRLRGLNLADLGEYINRELWLNEFPDCSGELSLGKPELPRALWVQATLSGELPKLVQALTQRALCAGLQHSQAGELPAIQGEHFAAEFAHTLAPLEAAYHSCMAEFANRDACAQAMEILRPGLLRIRYHAATFANQDAAAEARLCVRDDDESLAALGDRVGVTSTEGVIFASDLDSVTATRLLSAAVGDCTLPNETHTIYRVLAKIEPALSDPAVLDRVRQHCLTAALRPHLDKIKWASFSIAAE